MSWYKYKMLRWYTVYKDRCISIIMRDSTQRLREERFQIVFGHGHGHGHNNMGGWVGGIVFRRSGPVFKLKK